MDTHKDILTPIRLGFVLLPRYYYVSLDDKKIEFRGLDRNPGVRFDSFLPDDPDVLKVFASKAIDVQSPLGFYHELGQANTICQKLNTILTTLRQQDKNLGSFTGDSEYEVVGSNIEENAIVEINSEETPINRIASNDPLAQLLGYDVAYLNGKFSAISHGLFGLTHYLDVFLSQINENGLFNSFAAASNFRDAYLNSPSKEIGKFYVHRLYLPNRNSITIK